MHFKVTARTILQLGSELISSDAIAFYELIKNAFDAQSKKVEVRIVVTIPHNLIERCIEEYSEWTVGESFSKTEFNKAIAELVENIGLDSIADKEIREQIINSNSPLELCSNIKRANYIIIKDQGDGMSLKELEEIYLTIGTTNRKKQRDINTILQRPVLGEKGLGRLSVMRLGDGLLVETTQQGERNYNLLEIDWTIFSHNSDALLDSVDITPKKGRPKTDPAIKGTTIQIFSLRSEWTKDKLRKISESQLGRFIDPFEKKNRDFITLWFNKEPIILQGVDKILFDYAHASGKARLEFDSKADPVFQGEIHYRTYDRHKTFSLEGTHLASILGNNRYKETLHKLGPFSVDLYWYNRKLLRESLGVLDADYIKELVSTWGGGLMLYRDGFRVNPYGGPGDDWLGLDPTALASPGYKLNRKQIVGKVDISSVQNPLLLDQTNREGLRENAEKNALVSLLQYFIWGELKMFLDDIKQQEDENLAALSLNEIEKRIETGQDQVREAIKALKMKYPEIKNETETLTIIEDVLQESSKLFKSAKASADVMNDRLKTTIDLAGLGLMVDVIAHELNRSSEHALRTINSLPTSDLPRGIQGTMDNLKLQLKTLQTRLKVIDPLGPSGRQQKVLTDINRIIIDTVNAHQSQFKRHNIHFELKDENPSMDWKIRVVPGMILQILENLINNSVYWIKQQQNVNRLKRAEIEIKIDRKEKAIFFSDNGPGIPRSKMEDVFRPFFSTKPPGDGKGLGLYISREVAKYHNASLSLLDEPKKMILNTFVLSLKNS